MERLQLRLDGVKLAENAVTVTMTFSHEKAEGRFVGRAFEEVAIHQDSYCLLTTAAA
jgi:hypothetical protein